MKQRFEKLIVKQTSKVCSSMAKSVSASACFWGMFQPKEPKCLRK